MAYEQKDMTGSIFTNAGKQKENQPEVGRNSQQKV